MDNRYRTNKYPEIAEWVHKLVQAGYYDQTVGMVEQLGKFSLTLFSTGDIANIMHMDWDSDRRPRAAIVNEMSTGFVLVTFFTNVTELWKMWNEIEDDYDRYFSSGPDELG